MKVIKQSNQLTVDTAASPDASPSSMSLAEKLYKLLSPSRRKAESTHDEAPQQQSNPHRESCELRVFELWKIYFDETKKSFEAISSPTSSSGASLVHVIHSKGAEFLTTAETLFQSVYAVSDGESVIIKEWMLPTVTVKTDSGNMTPLVQTKSRLEELWGAIASNIAKFQARALDQPTAKMESELRALYTEWATQKERSFVFRKNPDWLEQVVEANKALKSERAALVDATRLLVKQIT